MKYSILILSTFFWCCSSSPDKTYHEISGTTMGTYYRITFLPNQLIPTPKDVDSLLEHINMALSTYIPESVISRFNRSAGGLSSSDIPDPDHVKYFFDNLSISAEIFKKSSGFFDPTVMPLVNYWGFGYDGTRGVSKIDTGAIDSIRQFVGLNKLEYNTGGREKKVEKKDTRMQLDFSAVAKGYAIDRVVDYLKNEFKIRHLLVDIGGEARAMGVNPDGEIWRIGINEPSEDSGQQDIQLIVRLKDMAVATSGNYRNYYELDGQKISHTINPHSGFYERNDLLSASVFADECGYADALATACMASGYEKAKVLIENSPGLEAIFIYIDDKNNLATFITPGIREFVVLPNGVQ